MSQSEDEEREDGQNGEGDHEGHLIVVFHIFILVLLGAFVRQVGIKLGLKYPFILLNFAGMLIGVYFVYFPDEPLFIVQSLGTQVIQTAYTPVYFFLGTFNLEPELIHRRAVPHALACVLAWVTTTVSVSYLCVYWIDPHSHFTDYVVFAVIVFTSDMKITKHFTEASHSFSTKEIFILLELEALITSLIASITNDIYYAEIITGPEHILGFILRTMFFCTFAFMFGKLAATFIDRMHHDDVNQMTTMFTSVLLMYAGASALGASGDLTVVIFGVTLLRARPGFSLETVSNVNRFIEAYRYAQVACIQVIGGVLMTEVLYHAFNFKYVMCSVTVYLSAFGCRFFFIIGCWLIFRKDHHLPFTAILTVCTFNVKSLFALVLTMKFFEGNSVLHTEKTQLFILATFQIFLSTIVTKPVSSLFFSIQDNQTVVEKFAMVQKALDRINENKESTIRACRCNQFTADADWSTIQQTTNVEKGFFSKFARSFQVKDFDPNFEDESRTRPDAIKDLLRLQKRLLAEQVKHGTITARSAKHLSHLLRNHVHKSTMIPSAFIIDSTGPSAVTQITLRDTAESIESARITKRWWIAMVSTLFLLDMFLNVYSTITKLFMFTTEDSFICLVASIYGLLMAILGIVFIFTTGSNYFHTVNSTLWNVLAWVFTVLSLLALAMDYYSFNLMSTDGRVIHVINARFDAKNRGYFVITMLSFAIVFLRSSILTCGLHPVQCFLHYVASSVLQARVFNQCDECYGFLQLVVDTHKRLKTRGMDNNIELAAAEILHREGLAMRQYLSIMEVLTPEVMTALRTRIASRLVLSSQEKIISDLSKGNVLEHKEVEVLTTILRTKHRDVASLKNAMAEPSEHDLIVGIPWVVMAGLSFRDIMDATIEKSYKPGQIIVQHGQRLKGLIVITKGVVRMESVVGSDDSVHSCTSNSTLKEECVLRGSPSDKFSAPVLELSDFYTRGNVIGEFQCLVDKTEHKLFRCVTDVKVLFIPQATIVHLDSKSAKMKGPLKLLEYSMWTTVAVRQAVRLILWNSSNQLLTRCKVYMIMEDAFLLDCKEIKIEQMQLLHRSTVVLLLGEVVCPVTGRHYHGPIVLPASLIDVYWRRPSAFHKMLRGNKNVILVIPGYLSLLGNDTRRRLDENEPTRFTSDANVSLVTISSGSSDGIPYRHYHTRSQPLKNSPIIGYPNI